MKRITILWMGLAVSLSLMVMGGLFFAQAASQQCCIAGVYEGHYKDFPNSCADPETGTFLMSIEQNGCGSSIKGRIKGKGPQDTWLFTGNVISAGRCCKARVISEEGGNVTTVTFTLCKGKDGTYYSKDGEYQNPAGCSGTFTLKQK